MHSACVSKATVLASGLCRQSISPRFLRTHWFNPQLALYRARSARRPAQGGYPA